MAIFTAVSPAFVVLRTRISAVKPCTVLENQPLSVLFWWTGGSYIPPKVPEPDIDYQNILGVILHRSRANKLFVYRRGKRYKTFTLTFVGLTKFDHTNFESFIDEIRGKLINFKNEYGDVFFGTISNYSSREGIITHGFDEIITFENENG